MRHEPPTIIMLSYRLILWGLIFFPHSLYVHLHTHTPTWTCTYGCRMAVCELMVWCSTFLPLQTPCCFTHPHMCRSVDRWWVWKHELALMRVMTSPTHSSLLSLQGQLFWVPSPGTNWISHPSAWLLKTCTLTLNECFGKRRRPFSLCFGLLSKAVLLRHLLGLFTLERTANTACLLSVNTWCKHLVGVFSLAMGEMSLLQC